MIPRFKASLNVTVIDSGSERCGGGDNERGGGREGGDTMC